MNERAFRAMNTEWWLCADVPAPSLAEAEATVREAEARLSRFRPDSALSELNRHRWVEDPWLTDAVRVALRLRDESAGAFDPAVGGAVIAAGYDRSFEHLPAVVSAIAPPRARPIVELEGSAIRLHGDGLLDLGGVAKGWTVDRVAAQLRAAGARSFVVDGGGDLRCAGRSPGGEPWAIGVADDLALLAPEPVAVCTSSVTRRRWRTHGGEGHHIACADTAQPSTGEVVAATVVGADAASADAWATALVASDGRCLGRLSLHGLEALLQRRGAGWAITPGLEWRLR